MQFSHRDMQNQSAQIKTKWQILLGRPWKACPYGPDSDLCHLSSLLQRGRVLMVFDVWLLRVVLSLMVESFLVNALVIAENHHVCFMQVITGNRWTKNNWRSLQYGLFFHWWNMGFALWSVKWLLSLSLVKLWRMGWMASVVCIESCIVALYRFWPIGRWLSVASFKSLFITSFVKIALLETLNYKHFSLVLLL